MKAHYFMMLVVTGYLVISIPISAQREHEEQLGEDFKYEALLGDRKPPLDFRKPSAN